MGGPPIFYRHMLVIVGRDVWRWFSSYMGELYYTL